MARRFLGAVPFNQTCSIGIATWDGEESAYELVRRADQGMDAAKAAGGAQSLPMSIRDRAVVALRMQHEGLHRQPGDLRVDRAQE